MPEQQTLRTIDPPEVTIQPYLASGEEVVWAGRSDREQYRQEQMDYVVGACVVAVLFTLLLSAVMDERAILALLPIVIGFALRFGWFIQHEDRHSVYAVTRKRLLILQLTGLTQVKSYRLGKVARIDVVQKERGVGTINFSCRVLQIVDGKSAEWIEQAEFTLVPRADAVAAKVHSLLGGDPS